jgi:hypothetical protein
MTTDIKVLIDINKTIWEAKGSDTIYFVIFIYIFPYILADNLTKNS